MRGKQSVRKGVWYLGGRKRLRKRTKGGQRGGALPRGLIASAAAQLVSEIAKPLLKKKNWWKKKEKTMRQNILLRGRTTP